MAIYHTDNCNWLPLNNFLFQIANVLLVFSYFVPDNLNGLFLLRFFLGTAGLFFALWGWMILCAPDTFGWNVFFMIGNYIHALYLFIHIKRPRKFPAQCEAVFKELFEPHGVQRFQFQLLAKQSKVMELRNGEFYAKKGVPADQISILLKGRVDVTSEDHIVHVTRPFEFLDSPEWVSSKLDQATNYDISLVAHEDIQLLHWNSAALKKILKKEKFLKIVFDSLIGQDVTKKLLSITKNLSDLKPGFSAYKASSILYLHHNILDAGKTQTQENVHMVQRMLVENSTPNSHLDSLHSHALDINDITPLYPHHSPQLGSRTSGISLQKAVKIFSPANQESAPLIGNAACDVDDETKPFDLEPERETVL